MPQGYWLSVQLCIESNCVRLCFVFASVAALIALTSTFNFVDE